MSRFKKGDFVLIKSRRLGGEVTDPSPKEGYVSVKLAEFNPYNNQTSIRTEEVPESDLEPITQRKGVLIV